MRQGQWSYSLPFSLNNKYYSDFTQTVPFQTVSLSVEPIMSEFNVDGESPSGYRHLTSHASFVKTLASGTGLALINFGAFDLNAVDISIGSGITKTKCFIFRINKFQTNNTRVHNMKIWASDMSDFLTPETNKIVYEVHNTWQSGISFPISYMLNKSKWLPTSLPDIQNLFRQDGKFTIHGSGDADVSQYVYVALSASGTTPLGVYGYPSSGFKIRVTYNFDNMYTLFD